MASIVNESLKHTGKAVFEDNKDSAQLVCENEKHIDDMYEKVGNYLNRISTVMLNETDRAKKRSLRFS